MKKSILFNLVFISIFFNVGCQKKEQKINFKLPKDTEINSIIETIIHSDSLPVSKSNKTKNSIPFCIDLKKIKIISWNEKTDKLVPMLMENEILIQDLIGYKDLESSYFFFNKSDSLYIQFQNKNLNNYIISKNISDKISTTTLEEQNAKLNAKEKYGYYYSTIPIISLDGKKAYLELVLRCPGLCGSSYKIY